MRAQWVCSRERRIALYKQSSINQSINPLQFHFVSAAQLLPNRNTNTQGFFFVCCCAHESMIFTNKALGLYFFIQSFWSCCHHTHTHTHHSVCLSLPCFRCSAGQDVFTCALRKSCFKWCFNVLLVQSFVPPCVWWWGDPTDRISMTL